MFSPIAPLHCCLCGLRLCVDWLHRKVLPWTAQLGTVSASEMGLRGGRACSFCLFVTQSLSPRPVEGSSQWTRLGRCETFVVLVLTLYVGRYRTFVFSAQFGVFMA